MKKSIKIILSIVLVLIVAAAGTGYYFLKVKTYNVADKKVEKITKGKYNIVLPGQTEPGNQPATNTNSKSKTASTSQSGNTTSTTASSTKSSTQTASAGSQSGKTTASETQTGKVTAASIKEKYRPTFESLESQANARIHTLLAAAAAEYKSKKAKGESISVPYFYQKYEGAGASLEGQTDAAFNYIYSALQSDLKANGFSPSEAKSFKTTYENTKSNLRSSLLSQAKSMLF